MEQERVYATHGGFRAALRPGYYVHVFHTLVHLSSTVGGAISPRVHHKKVTQLSPAGTLVEIKGQVGACPFTVVGTYLPRETHPSPPGSLLTKVQEELTRTKEVINDPYEYLKTNLHETIVASRVERRLITVGGDLNTDLTPLTDSQSVGVLLTALGIHHCESSIERPSPTWVNGKHSKRLDHLLTSTVAMAKSVNIVRTPQFLLDHAAMVGSFWVGKIDAMDSVWLLALRQIKKARFDYASPKDRQQMSIALANIKPDLSLSYEAQLRQLTADTMTSVNTLYGTLTPPRHKICRHWCPDNVALEIGLKLVSKINHHVQQRRFRSSVIVNHVAAANECLHKLAKGVSEQLSHFQTLSPFMPQYWAPLVVLSPEALKEHINFTYKALKHELNTRVRKKRRDAFTETYKKQNFQFQIGRISPALANIFGSKAGFKLEVLHQGDTVVTDQGTINYDVVQFFFNWFDTTIEHKKDEWFSLLTHQDEFHQHANQMCVPQHIADILWTSVDHRPPDKEAHKQFQSAIVEAATYKRFRKKLSDTSNGSAGGLLGLTYDLIKMWPEETIQLAYNALCGMWESKTIPVEWTRRWLHLIPKTDNPTLDDLRPICLLEVFRKLWVSLLIEVINEFVHTESVLSPGQHCGKGKGTESGSSELCAALEAAKLHFIQIFLTSWDLRRAFDSVPRGVLLFAWTRIGVPQIVAYYLINLDVNAIMVPKTPLTQLVNHHEGYQQLERLGLTFHPRQGTPQGGNEASDGFKAVIDILLRALTSVDDNDYMTLDTDDRLTNMDPDAYVDDLLSISSSVVKLQLKADIVSTFCLIFQMFLNVKKFRAFHLNWGNDKGQEATTQITIHEKGWTPRLVTLDGDGKLTHLGITRDCDLSDCTQFCVMYDKVALALYAVMYAKVLTEVKLAAIKLVIYPESYT